MTGLAFVRNQNCLREPGASAGVALSAKLLLAALVLAGTLQAQTTPNPSVQYCAPGILCPVPEAPPKTSEPDTITSNPEKESQRDQDEEQPEDQMQKDQEERDRTGEEGEGEEGDRLREEREKREGQREKKPATRRPQPGLEAGRQRVPPKPKEYTEFQHFVFSSVGRMLPMYGYDLFEKVPSTFAPVDRIPVTADYVIGPGDELVIHGWGQIQMNVRATVDRNGSVFIPKVGNVRVAGLRYHQLHDYLQTAVGRIFQNFELNVSLGELRSIQVFVVGHARRPGSYTVSSLSTLVNTLFASGGPAPTGSMRKIQLKRNNQVVTEFDFYDLLLNGDKSKDAALLPGDVIYIAPIGPQVAVAGSVNVPAIYEIKENTTLGDGLQLAGLLGTMAEGQKATVERIANRTVRKVEEFPLDASGLARPLHDGDVVNILPLSPRFDNAVTLRGHVARPGRYPWHEGMRISDLIPDKEMLLTREYYLSQNLFAEGEAAQKAREATRKLIVKTQEHPTVEANEALRKSKRNPPDKLLSEVNWDYAFVNRLNREDLTTSLLPFNLAKAVIDRDEANNFLLQPGDVVTVLSRTDVTVPIAEQTKYIQLEGEFKSAGFYQARRGDTLHDLVDRAGGLTPDAYLFGAQFTRESTRIEQQKRLETFLNEMERDVERIASSVATRSSGGGEEALALQSKVESNRRLVQRLRQVKPIGRIVLEMKTKDPTLVDLPNMSLEDGDHLLIPARPATVNVIGAVYNENAHLYRPNRRVSDYLRAAGGMTRQADTKRMFVIRADGSVVGRASTSRLWGSGFDSLRLMPGDSIVVPERLDKSDRGRAVRDWVQLASQIALSAAVFRSFTK